MGIYGHVLENGRDSTDNYLNKNMTFKELELLEELLELTVKKSLSNELNKLLKAGIVADFHGNERLEQIKQELTKD